MAVFLSRSQSQKTSLQAFFQREGALEADLHCLQTHGTIPKDVMGSFSKTLTRSSSERRRWTRERSSSLGGAVPPCLRRWP